PDLAELGVQPGDVLAMCSDGLINHVHDDELAKRLSCEAPLQETCDGLIDLANQRGGEDNITVVLLRMS
ncbi:MAG: SpoIIE family protein phosphatase, partial [Deltaproteobacteria bacterium]|nr:SpoIIE family protein phosphatase [Deltaproteobacteria bacterium]